ncbi:MAG: NAD-dependent epimerase/dehydratase family protein [Alphaproteobacteria bacterium]|nr:NAD-dependent epimerase/dehydratase family protein [Alphaproteobacteria bacterium]
MNPFRLLLGAVALYLSAAIPASAKDDVLIVGGAGNTGAAVAKALIARGDKVTVLVRPTTDRALLKDVLVEYAVADVLEAEQVAATLAGKKFTVVFETLQMLSGVDDRYTLAYRNLIAATRGMGLRQFLVLGAACSDRAAKDCPLSPPLYKVSADMSAAERVLRESGIPYTVIRQGSLMPGGPSDPDHNTATGTSFLTEDLSVFGAALRADLNQQIIGCIGNQKCIGKIYVIDDPSIRPQLDHWLCKRRHETDTIIFSHPDCGPFPPITVRK